MTLELTSEQKLNLIGFLIGEARLDASERKTEGEIKVLWPEPAYERYRLSHKSKSVVELKAVESVLYDLISAENDAARKQAKTATSVDAGLSPSRTNLSKSKVAMSKITASYSTYLASKIRLKLQGNDVTNANHLARGDFDNLVPNDTYAQQLLGLCTDAIPPTYAPPFDLEEILSTKLEKTAQEVLRNHAALLHAHDTSQGGTDSFTLPQKMLSEDRSKTTDNVYVLSARPDLSAAFGHAYLDIKPTSVGVGLIDNDFGVLDQIGDRVYADRSAHGPISKSVTFGVTGRSAWVAIFLREDNREETIEIVRISHRAVFYIWNQLYERVQNTNYGYWLTEDGKWLVATLQYLQTDYRCCVVEHCATSSSSVYTVATPKQFTYCSESKSAIGAVGNRSCFCIKVNADFDRLNGEVGALAAVDPLYTAAGVELYASGSIVSDIAVSVSYSPPTDILAGGSRARKKGQRVFPYNNTPFYTAHLVEGAVPADKSKLITVSPGGVIIMRMGLPASTQLRKDAALWLRGVDKCLEIIHSAGYCHCDVRAANILDFRAGIQLIDFDLAVPSGSIVNIQRGSSQWVSAGTRIACLLEQSAVNSVNVAWTAEDDGEMLRQTMLNKWFS